MQRRALLAVFLTPSILSLVVLAFAIATGLHHRWVETIPLAAAAVLLWFGLVGARLRAMQRHRR